MLRLCEALCSEPSLFEKFKWKDPLNTQQDVIIYISVCVWETFNSWIQWLRNLHLNSTCLQRWNVTQPQGDRGRVSVTPWLRCREPELSFHQQQQVGRWNHELLLRYKQENRKQRGRQEAVRGLGKMMERGCWCVFENVLSALTERKLATKV